MKASILYQWTERPTRDSFVIRNSVKVIPYPFGQQKEMSALEILQELAKEVTSMAANKNIVIKNITITE